MKKIIAREGLLLISVILVAWFISNTDPYRQLIYNTGLCGVKNMEGLMITKMAGDNFDLEVRPRTELVEHRIFLYGFISIFLGYFLLRFIMWALRKLK